MTRFGNLSKAARGKEVLNEVIKDLKKMNLSIDFAKVGNAESLREALNKFIKLLQEDFNLLQEDFNLCAKLRGYRDVLVEIESFGKLRNGEGIPLYVFHDATRLLGQLTPKNVTHVSKSQQLLSMNSVSDFLASTGRFSDLEKVECAGHYALSRDH